MLPLHSCSLLQHRLLWPLMAVFFAGPGVGSGVDSGGSGVDSGIRFGVGAG